MPFLASITWPPFTSRSYLGCAKAHDAINKKAKRRRI
jgi:hypothetical protein